MRISIFFSILYFVFLANAKSVESTSFSIRKILPEKIQSISISKTSKKEIQSKLGKPDLIEGTHAYYQIEKLKYDLEISYNDNIVNYYSFTFSTKHFSIKDLGIKIDEKKLRPYLASGKPTKYFIYNYLNYDLVLNPIDWSLYSLKVHQ
jgi:hypothetical protein